MLRQLGLTSLIAATLLLSACKSKSQEPALAPTAPAPTTAEAPARPAEPAPVADDTLSLAQEDGDKCKWVRADASSNNRKDVFTFDGGCELVQLAWSHDGRKGAILQSFEDERPPRAWTVDLLKSQGMALPLPEVGRTQELGFDPEDHLVALVAHYDLPGMKPPERVEENGQTSFVFEGKKYPVELQAGELGLAHAYRREGAAWKRVETQVTSYTDDGSKTQVLELAKKLGPTSMLDSKPGPQSESVSPEEKEALDASAPLVGPRGEDIEDPNVWVRIALPGGPLYYKEEQGESVSQLVPLRWNVGGKLIEPEKLALPADASISLAARGHVLLVSSDKALRVYDAKQKKLLLALEGVSLPRFWPRPR